MKKLFTLSIGALSFVGCSSDNEDTSNPNQPHVSKLAMLAGHPGCVITVNDRAFDANCVAPVVSTGDVIRIYNGHTIDFNDGNLQVEGAEVRLIIKKAGVETVIAKFTGYSEIYDDLDYIDCEGSDVGEHTARLANAAGETEFIVE